MISNQIYENRIDDKQKCLLLFCFILIELDVLFIVMIQ